MSVVARKPKSPDLADLAKAGHVVSLVGDARATPTDAGPGELTDVGNARRLVRRHGEDLLFVPGPGAFAWDGRRFKQDDSEAWSRFAQESAESLFEDVKAAGAGQRGTALARHAVTSLSAPRIAAAVSLAKTSLDVQARPEELDADPYLLNVANGTLELRTGTLRRAARADRITKLSRVPFEPDAKAPTWHAFLDRVQPDPERRGFLQRLLGYCLTGVTTEQILALLYGLGANGKSVLVEVWREILGEYASATPFDSLLPRRDAGAPRDDLARLAGARLVTASEPNDGVRLDEGLVKALTGGDVVTARPLFGRYFDFRPTWKFLLCTNHKPEIRGTDHGIWRRIRLVPFDVTVPDHEQDQELPLKLRAELPGILRWAVEGCLAWQAGGLAAPPAVLEATAEYREEESPFTAFLAERCEVAAAFLVTPSELHTAYSIWAEANDAPGLTMHRLAPMLRAAGFKREKALGDRVWRGLRLKAQDTSDASDALFANLPRAGSHEGSYRNQAPKASSASQEASYEDLGSGR